MSLRMTGRGWRGSGDSCLGTGPSPTRRPGQAPRPALLFREDRRWKCKHTPAAAPRLPDFRGQPASQCPQARRSLVTAPGDRAGSLHRLRRPIPDPTCPPLGGAAELIPRELGALGSPAGMGRVRPTWGRVALTAAGCGSRGTTGREGHALDSLCPARPRGTVPEPEWPGLARPTARVVWNALAGPANHLACGEPPGIKVGSPGPVTTLARGCPRCLC